MTADYKNWMPRGMVFGASAGAAAAAVLLALSVFWGFGATGTFKTVLIAVLAAVLCGMLIFTFLSVSWYNAFSYNGKRQVSKKVIQAVASYVTIPEGGTGLDVGCGSGALTIACAKRNPQAKMIGVDRWGKEYASYNKALCESNAACEGVSNVSFEHGDACKLDFPDETFDAVTSNYVYHNVVGEDRKALLDETLRVLKKGGTFALHDLMSPVRFGDMQAFADKLRAQGYEQVELIDTTERFFKSKREAALLALGSSTLLTGRK